MKVNELIKMVHEVYPYCVIRQETATVILAIMENPTVEYCKEWMMCKGEWRDYFEATTIEDAKAGAAKDGVAIYYKSEVPALLEKYNVENEEKLDEYFWMEIGADLFLVDDMKKEFFPISYVSREDLEHIGYDTSYVSDDAMKKLSSKLGDDYCEQLFWSSLDVIADSLGIPKKK